MEVEAGLVSATAIVIAPIARDRDQRDSSRREPLVKSLRKLVTVHPRKADIEQGDIRHEAVHDGERRRPVERNAYPMAMCAQHLGNEIGCVAVVVDDEDVAGDHSVFGRNGRNACGGCSVVCFFGIVSG